MNRIIVYDFSPGLTDKFSGENVIPRLSNWEDIDLAYSTASRTNRVFCIWVDMPYTSLSDLSFQCAREDVPIVLHIYNLGDTYVALSKLEDIKRLNLRIFLNSSRKENLVSLKILSSLGIDCGVLMNAGQIDDEAFVDLASYVYLSQVPHASVEPFDYIWRNLQQDSNLDFSTVFFENPGKYIYVNESLDFSYTLDDLKKGQFVGNMGRIDIVDFEADFKSKLSTYYSHFLSLDECSKCPAFKVCNRKMMGSFSDCKSVFSSLFEYAEIRDNIERERNHAKELCQL